MPVLGIKASADELSQLFDMFDQDGDTFITFREFNRIMRKVSEAEAKEGLRFTLGHGIGPSDAILAADRIIQTAQAILGTEKPRFAR
jgi:hypothetical protein